MNASLHRITESILSHLEPRDVMDFLYQEHALSEDDMELVNAKVTRTDRCRLLVERLAERNNKVKTFRTFVRSLQDQYEFLTEKASKHVEEFVRSLSSTAARASGGTVMCISPISQQGCHSQSNRKSRVRQTDISMAMPPSSKGRCSRYISRLYDYLSTELNRGEFSQFEAHTQQLLSDKSADVRCLVLYLQACQAMFQNDMEEAVRKCNETRAFVPKTTNPVKYGVEILSVMAWRYFKLGKLNKLNNLLTGAIQQINSHPTHCSGKIAGWIYVDHVHMLSTMLESANPKRARALRTEALTQIQVAIQHFDREKGKDGPFGKSFAQIMFSGLLLQCGNRMQFATLKVAEVYVRKAESLLRKVENSDIGIPDILRVFYSISMADLFFRKGNLERATDHAKDALRVSAKLQMDKENELANIRVSILSTICDNRNLSLTYLSTLALDTSYSRSSERHRKDRFTTGFQAVNDYSHNAWITTFLNIVDQIRFLALILCIGVGFLIPVV